MHHRHQDHLAHTLATTTTPYTPLYEDLDHAQLSLVGLQDAATAFERLAARAAALQAGVLAALEQRVAAEAHQRAHGNTESELCAALRLPPGTLRTRLAHSAYLVERFPETRAQLAQGAVSWPQVRSLIDLTTCLTDEQARAVQDRVLPDMPTQTPAVTRRRIDRAVHTIDPDGAAQRHAERAQRRRVELRPEPDGMATLSLFTRAETARAILTTLDEACKKKTRNDPRTLDQRRADTLAAIILNANGTGTGSGPATPAAMVHLVITADTLLGLSDAPALLEGYGAITPDHARALVLAPGSKFRRLFLAPTGRLQHVDPGKYPIPAFLGRFIKALYRTCSFPCCQMPARKCEIDHAHSYATGGCTCEENLHPACHFHHDQKTAGLWEVHKNGDTVIWTSTTTARSYTSTPEPYTPLTYTDLIE